MTASHIAVGPHRKASSRYLSIFVSWNPIFDLCLSPINLYPSTEIWILCISKANSPLAKIFMWFLNFNERNFKTAK